MQQAEKTIDRAFTEPLATTLADKRNKAWQKGCRILYDCRRNEVVQNGRVRCQLRHTLGPANDGSLSLLETLKGVTPATCKECEDYWGWEEEE